MADLSKPVLVEQIYEKEYACRCVWEHSDSLAPTKETDVKYKGNTLRLKWRCLVCGRESQMKCEAVEHEYKTDLKKWQQQNSLQ